jgi:hypothetical protein
MVYTYILEQQDGARKGGCSLLSLVLENLGSYNFLQVGAYKSGGHSLLQVGAEELTELVLPVDA